MVGRPMKRAFSILFVFLAPKSFATAQSFRGPIVGTVKDGTGAVLPGVEIIATNTGTAASRNVISGETGEYSVPLLPPGTYTVSAALPGFKTNLRSGITLLVDQTARIDFTLEIGEVSEKVEVTGDAPLINTESSTVGTVIANSQVVELPLN